MKKKLALIILISLVTLSCKTESLNDNFDYGKVENNIYSNSFFNFKITVPEGWVVQTREQTEEIANIGKNMLAGDDENLKAVIKASEINTANLLMAFQYEVGSAVEYNPSIVVATENLKLAPGIKTGKDYLYQSKKILKQAQIKYDYIDEGFEKTEIQNKEFYTMNLSITQLGLKIKQRFYTTIDNSFSVNFIISYVTEEQRVQLEKIIETLEFKD